MRHSCWVLLLACSVLTLSALEFPESFPIQFTWNGRSTLATGGSVLGIVGIVLLGIEYEQSQP